MFGRKKQAESKAVLPVAQTVPARYSSALPFGCRGQSRAERELYSALRESVPIIDAAIGKIVRLMGGFRIITEQRSAQPIADAFVREVRANGSSSGLGAFVNAYIDDLLTYGEAVGEMLLNENQTGVCALYNASLNDVTIRAGSSPLELVVCTRFAGGEKPAPNQNLVLASLLFQENGTVRGRSLLSGLPFISSILLKIFNSIKNNWERAGDVRFAVTYDPKGAPFSEESARQIADEWKKAIRSDTVCDFVSVGDVSVKVIGAESEMPDCSVPVKVILEQVVAKLGIPPFLLGISWSSTERMSAQQADILTSELEYYRSAVTPAIRKIVGTHLRLSGCSCDFRLIWDDVNLQDAVELSQARLHNARAAQIEKEYGLEEYENA